MTAFVPPFPPRLTQSPTALQRLMLARRNVLSIWEVEAFDLEFSSARLFRRMVFVCSCPEAVQFAFQLHNESFERKSPQQRNALKPILGDGLVVSDGSIWRRRRQIVAPIVHVSRRSEFAPVMVEAALETRAHLAGLEGQQIDAQEEIAKLTTEIICRTLFGRKLGHEHAAAIVGGFTDYQRHIGQMDILSFLGVPDWLPRWQHPGARRAARRVHRALDEIIDDFRKHGHTRENPVIRQLIEARDKETGKPLDSDAIRNEAAVLFLAGNETSANAMTWALYLLSQAPEVEARFHAEIDTVIGDRVPTLADVPALIYTRAVLDEAMRLFPPIPFLSRETQVTERFRDKIIPKGSMVMVAPWLLHRHKRYWDQPDHFIPERFLPENAAKLVKLAYIPFSTGPRVCAGMSFALTEAILCLAVLGQTLRLRLKPGHVVQPVARLSLRPDGGLPMTIERRAATLRPPTNPDAQPGITHQAGGQEPGGQEIGGQEIGGKCPVSHS